MVPYHAYCFLQPYDSLFELSAVAFVCKKSIHEMPDRYAKAHTRCSHVVNPIVNIKSCNPPFLDRWAALWPFIGIVVEVTVLVAAILLYERHQIRSKPVTPGAADNNANVDANSPNGATNDK